MRRALGFLVLTVLASGGCGGGNESESASTETGLATTPAAETQTEVSSFEPLTFRGTGSEVVGSVELPADAVWRVTCDKLPKKLYADLSLTARLPGEDFFALDTSRDSAEKVVLAGSHTLEVEVAECRRWTVTFKPLP